MAVIKAPSCRALCKEILVSSQIEFRVYFPGMPFQIWPRRADGVKILGVRDVLRRISHIYEFFLEGDKVTIANFMKAGEYSFPRWDRHLT